MQTFFLGKRKKKLYQYQQNNNFNNIEIRRLYSSRTKSGLTFRKL